MRASLYPAVMVVCISLINLVTWADAPPPPAWLKDITRVGYTDLPNRQSQGDWPEQLLADAAAAKVQMFFSRVHSGDEWKGLAWNSAYGDADPMMKGDGTRHVVELCHRYGMHYMGYYWAQREPMALGDAHPDWKCLNSHGKPTVYYCVNNPEYRALVRNRVVELVTKIGCDGVFFDMFHARADECYCKSCVEKFKAQTGQAPPTKEDFSSPLWQQWVNFKYRTLEEAMLDFNLAMKASNPQAALMVNTWNAWVYRNTSTIRNSIRVVENVDGLLEEIGWYDTVDPSFFAFPAHYNFMSWHLGGLCKDKRAFMWSSPSYLRSQSLGATEARIRTGIMMTNGSVPAQSIPGRDVMAQYLAQTAQRDAFFANDRIAPWCGLVVSEKAELWYGKDEPKARYIQGVYGAFQAMMERHLNASLVTDRELERGKLDPYKVLFLPNCAAMADSELETIRQFVRDGGGVVATYETSAYDEHGKPRDNFGLADVFDATRVEALDTHRLAGFGAKPTTAVTLSLPPTFRWGDDAELTEEISRRQSTESPTMIHHGVRMNCRMLLVDPTDKRKCPVRLQASIVDKPGDPPRRQEHAGIIETTYGKGKVIYLPMDLSWMYFRYGQAYLARLMELALREAASEPPRVEVNAPSIVQAMTHVQGNRVVVHLLNDISSFGRSMNVAGQSLYERREVIPIHDIKVTFRGTDWKHIYLVPGEKRLETTPVPEGLQVSLPPLEIHSMVVAEP